MSYLPHSQKRSERPNFRNSTTFDTALDFSEAVHACEGKLLPRSHPTDKTLVTYYSSQSRRICTDKDLWPKWIQRILLQPLRSNRNTISSLQDSCKVASTLLEFQYEALTEGLDPDIVRESFPLMEQFSSNVKSLPVVCQKFWVLASEFYVIVKASRICYSSEYRSNLLDASANSMEPIPQSLADSDMKFRFGNRLVFLENGSIVKVFPKEWLMMVFFKSLETFNVLTATHLRSGVDLQSNALGISVQYLEGCSQVLVVEGQKGFDKIKSLEGVHIGMIIKECDVFDSVPILDATIEELNQPIVRFSGSTLEAALLNSDYQLRTELLALNKLLGHPSVSSIAGFDKVLRRGCAPKKIDQNHLSDVLATSIKNVCTHYFSSHGRWPQVELDPGIGKRLQTAILRNWGLNDRRIPHSLPPTKLTEWLCVDLQQNAIFNYVSSIIPLLKDKSTSPTSDVASIYYQYCAGINKDYTHLSSEQRADSASRTRLLLSYVMKQSMGTNIKEFLHHFGVDFDAIADFLIIKLTAKEKELKREPRMFGLTTFENRSRLLLTSMNMFSYLDEYAPNVCFSLSKEALIKKLLAMKDLHQLSSDSVIPFFAHIDASGWCSAFRKEVCAPFGKLLDKWYGTRLFERAQEAYTATKLIAFEYGEYQEAEGMEGGIEGLDQPPWTSIYDNSVTTSLDALQYPSAGCVKGDDAKYAVLIPTVEVERNGYDVIATRLAREIQAAIERIGQQGKVEETFISTKLLTFGKKWCLDKIFLPNMNKALAKVHGYGESSFPTASDRIGTTFSNAHSSCSEGNLHVIPYTLACINACWHMHDFEYGCLSLYEKVALLSWPSCAGGMPILFLQNFFMNSESDQLTQFLCLVNFCKRNSHPMEPYLSRLLHLPISQSESLLPLCQDPYSLNISKPQEAPAILRHVMRSQIEKVTNNLDLKQVFSPTALVYQQDLGESLKTMNIAPAKAMAALYSGSILGLQQDILSKFETSHSMFSFLTRTRFGFRALKRLHLRLQKAERETVSWRMTLVQGKSLTPAILSNLRDLCSTKWAQDCRNYCWNKPVFGVTYPSLTEVAFCVPGNKGGVVLEDGTKIDIETSFILRRTPEGKYSTRYPTDHFRNGPYKPFLGKTTSEVLALPSLRLDSDSPCVAKVLQLLKLHAFMDVRDSDFNKLVTHALSYLTNKTIDELMPFRQTKQRGTTTHRLRSRGFKESVHINRYPNAYTLVQGDSSYNTDERLTENLSLNFLELLVYESEMALLGLEFSANLPCRPTEYFFALRKCDHCLASVDDTAILVGHIPSHGSPASSNLLAMDSEAISQIDEKLKLLHEKFTLPSPSKNVDISICKEILLSRFWRERRIDMRRMAASTHLTLKTHNANLARDLLGHSVMTKPADKNTMVTLTSLFRIDPDSIVQSMFNTFWDGCASRWSSAAEEADLFRTGIAYIAGGCSYMWDAGMGSEIFQASKRLLIQLGPEDKPELTAKQGVHSQVLVFLSALKVCLQSWAQQEGIPDPPSRYLDGTESEQALSEKCQIHFRKLIHDRMPSRHDSNLVPKHLRNPDDKWQHIWDHFDIEEPLRKSVYLSIVAVCGEVIHRAESQTKTGESYTSELLMHPVTPGNISREYPSRASRRRLRDNMGLTPDVVLCLWNNKVEPDDYFMSEWQSFLEEIKVAVIRTSPKSAPIAVPFAVDFLRNEPRHPSYSRLTEEDDPEEFRPETEEVEVQVPVGSFQFKGPLMPAKRVERAPSTGGFCVVEWGEFEELDDPESWFWVNKHNIVGRAFGSSTTGACEAHVLFVQLNIKVPHGPGRPRFACLADGHGGFSVYLAANYPNARVYYSNPPLLGSTTATATESRSLRSPTLLHEVKSVPENLDYTTLNWQSACDLTESHFWDDFSNRDLQISMLTITADTDDQSLRLILYNLCAYRNILTTGGVVVIGIRRRTLSDSALLQRLLNCFTTVSVVPNITNSYRGRDLWLIMEGPTYEEYTGWVWRQVRAADLEDWKQEQNVADPNRPHLLRGVMNRLQSPFRNFGPSALVRLEEGCTLIYQMEMYMLHTNKARVKKAFRNVTPEVADQLIGITLGKLDGRGKPAFLQAFKWIMMMQFTKLDWDSVEWTLMDLVDACDNVQHPSFLEYISQADPEELKELVRWSYARAVQLISYHYISDFWDNPE